MPQTINNMTATWNSGGTTFTGIRFNVTDTASAAGSLLMDLRVGGVSRISARKDGLLTIGSLSMGAFQTISAVSNNILIMGTSVSFDLNGSIGNIIANNAGSFSFSNSASAGSIVNADLSIFRDAADTLAQRRGVNAQTSRIYGTFTDASNYRRVAISVTTGGVASIKPEGAGTGASGNVLHISGLPTANPGPGILWDDGGTVKVGT
jgi:hypothetical protein